MLCFPMLIHILLLAFLRLSTIFISFIQSVRLLRPSYQIVWNICVNEQDTYVSNQYCIDIIIMPIQPFIRVYAFAWLWFLIERLFRMKQFFYFILLSEIKSVKLKWIAFEVIIYWFMICARADDINVCRHWCKNTGLFSSHRLAARNSQIHNIDVIIK